MRIAIRDYRGCERADIVLEPIALIAGPNENGKSSVAQAVQALLLRSPIVVPGLTKKQAAMLVRDGADEGSALLSVDGGTLAISWPKADASGESVKCSESAAGLEHIFDMAPNVRASILAAYIQAMPTQAEVRAAVLDAGYSETTADNVWKQLDGGSSAMWDAVWARAREYGSTQKGKWEAITGQAYGSKKGCSWVPDGLQGEADRDVLAARATAARDALTKVSVGAAVSEAEIERLRGVVTAAEGAEDPKQLAKDADLLRDEIQRKTAERLAMPSEAGADPHHGRVPCPACGAALVVEKLHSGPYKLAQFSERETTAAQKKASQKARAALDGTIANLKGQVAKIDERRIAASRLIENGLAAAAELQRIGSNAGASSEEIERAKRAAVEAELALSAFDTKTGADTVHAIITQNEKMIAILAPDGLRRRTMAKALDDFNARLAAVAQVAGWPSVRLDERMEPHYGARPVWAASKSGQWRARVMVQVAMARADGSAAVVIDDADVLVGGAARNGLFAMLAASGLRALVCMAISKRELVPDLAAAGIGHSYWIENGVAT